MKCKKYKIYKTLHNKITFISAIMKWQITNLTSSMAKCKEGDQQNDRTCSSESSVDCDFITRLESRCVRLEHLIFVDVGALSLVLFLLLKFEQTTRIIKLVHIYV